MIEKTGVESGDSTDDTALRAGAPFYWTDAQTDRLCELRNAGETFTAIGQALGTSRSSIASRLMRLTRCGDERLTNLSGKSRHGRCGPRKLVMPVDFADVAPGMSERTLALYYGVGRTTIGRWRKALDLTGFARTYSVPEGFAELAPTATLHNLGAYYGVHHRTVQRWCAEVGVQAKRAVVPFVRRGDRILPAPRVNRDLSQAGETAQYLRRFGPVYRCTATGRAVDAKDGTHWSRAGYVLTDDEIIDRAKRNGWQPDAWRKVA